MPPRDNTSFDDFLSHLKDPRVHVYCIQYNICIQYTYIEIKIIVKLTIPYQETTATSWLEFKRGEKYWIISTNCKIKIEIQIKDETPSQPATVIPAPTTSTTTSITTSTSITSERITQSLSNSSRDEVWIGEISKHEDTNEVDTRDEARIQDEINEIRMPDFFKGGFSGIVLTVFLIFVGYIARRIILCVRNRRRLERERMRGDSLATDLSYQTPREIFA